MATRGWPPHGGADGHFVHRIAQSRVQFARVEHEAGFPSRLAQIIDQCGKRPPIRVTPHLLAAKRFGDTRKIVDKLRERRSIATCSERRQDRLDFIPPQRDPGLLRNLAQGVQSGIGPRSTQGEIEGAGFFEPSRPFRALTDQRMRQRGDEWYRREILRHEFCQQQQHAPRRRLR